MQSTVRKSTVPAMNLQKLSAVIIDNCVLPKFS